MEDGSSTSAKCYSCPTCGKIMTHKTHFTRHCLTHTNLKPFCCNVCGANFNHPSNMMRHVKMKHGPILQQLYVDQHSDSKPPDDRGDVY